VNPTHITITVVLGAAVVVCLVIELTSCVLLLKRKTELAARPMLLGLASAVGAHLAVFGLTGHGWGAALCLLPFAAVVVMCAPREWQPPPRRARLARAGVGELATPAEQSVVVDGDQLSWTSTAGDAAVRPAEEPDPEEDLSAPLSASEQQAWESLRRSLGDS
jgi:hypothetical protein